MAQKTLEAIRKNISELYGTAILLHRRRVYAQSTHISIACLEECSKFAMVYCGNNLEDSIFRKRYSHIPKYKMLSTHFFVSGVLYMVYLLNKGIKLIGDPGLDLDVDQLCEHFAKLSGWNNPGALAELIVSRLEGRSASFDVTPPEYQMSEETRDRLVQGEQEFAKKTEFYRTCGLYVDFDEKYDLRSGPWEIQKETSFGYLMQAKLCMSVVSVLSMERIDFDAYFISIPRKYRNEISKNIEDLRERLSRGRESQASVIPPAS